MDCSFHFSLFFFAVVKLMQIKETLFTTYNQIRLNKQRKNFVALDYNKYKMSENFLEKERRICKRNKKKKKSALKRNS